MTDQQAARFSHESAVIGSRTWMWGGANHTHCFSRSHVEVYDPIEKTWTQHEAQATTDDNMPPPSMGSRCTPVGNTIYSFGGQSPAVGYLSDLYALDTDAVMWRRVTAVGERPPALRHCGLCSTDGKLFVFGGYGPRVGEESLKDGAQWVEMGDGKGVNNGFYEFDIQLGVWSHIKSSEHRPSPRNGHTLSAVGNKLILFGGRGADNNKLSDVHIYNIITKKWSGPIDTSSPWPQPRFFHTASPIHSNDHGSVIVVLGGIGGDSKPCTDEAYLFDVESLRWYQIRHHGMALDRYHHTTCCHVSQVDGERVVYVTVFGGSFSPKQTAQPVSAFSSFILGPENQAYMACEVKRLQDQVARLRRRSLMKEMDEVISRPEENITHHLLERTRQLECSKRLAEQKSIAVTAELRELTAQFQLQTEENQSLKEELVCMQQEQQTIQEQAQVEIQKAREQARIAAERAKREVQRTRQDNGRLHHIVDKAEAACHEMEQRLSVYMGVTTIKPEELQIEQRILGRGTFGVVQMGRLRGAWVAVKSFHNTVLTPEFDEVCQRELTICSRLHHPHIVQVCGTVVVNGTPVRIISELMQGSVQDLIKATATTRHYLSFREQIDLLTGTTAGLDYLHQLYPNPYVHGNIHSANVLVTRDMVAKVGDMGASYMTNRTISMGLISHDYVAPERIPKRDGSVARLTCQSDVYSLGVFLLELFTGQHPNRVEMTKRLKEIECNELQGLCTRMTFEDPSKRPFMAECLGLVVKQADTRDYKMLPGRRLVRGHIDGVDVCISDGIYV